MESEQKELAIDGFLRNDHEMVLGRLTEFHGKQYADLRVYVPSVIQAGEWIPTPKGVAIAVEHFEEVRDAIHELWDAAGDTIVARIPKNKHEEIWIGVQTFKSVEYCFVRVYYLYKSGEWKPSKKGISIPTAMLEKLDSLLDAMEEKFAEELAASTSSE